MAKLDGTKTHQNLKDAFAGESQANRRYLFFAKVADVEGYPEVAGLFKDTADGETGHAHGHLEFLKQVGDPDRAPHRADAQELEGRRRRRNARVRDHVSRHGEDGARRRLRGYRRLVRDPGEGREVSRRALRQGRQDAQRLRFDRASPLLLRRFT